jgi:hypothetical protein
VILNSDSHALRLAFRLLDLGVIERGKFTFILFQHDDNCAALRTQSALDCRCDVETVINGSTFSFGELVGAR